MERSVETLDVRLGVERGPQDEGGSTSIWWRSITRRRGGRVNLMDIFGFGDCVVLGNYFLWKVIMRIMRIGKRRLMSQTIRRVTKMGRNHVVQALIYILLLMLTLLR